MAVGQLPEELLVMICEHLVRRLDFSGLFRCAISSVAFSGPALRTMYRSLELAPLLSKTDELGYSLPPYVGRRTGIRARRANLARRWVLLWRSIIRSSLDMTYKPYCQYMRSLSLDGLRGLLNSAGFDKGEFFVGDLCDFHRQERTTAGRLLQTRQGPLRLEIVSVLHAVGEVVTKRTGLLEELIGPIDGESLPRWIQRSPRLQSLRLQQGSALGPETRAAIKENCPSFRSLIVRGWKEKDANDHVASLLTMTCGLHVLEFCSDGFFGRPFLLAMNHHAGTLTSITLHRLSFDDFLSLGCLKECTALQKLDLAGMDHIPQPNWDLGSEVLDWLNSCHSLTELAFFDMYHSSRMLAKVLKTRNFALTSLSVKMTYRRPGVAGFFAALSAQPRLLRLDLNATDWSLSSRELEILVDALSRLTELQSLALVWLSRRFPDHHISTLATNLPRLETFHLGGSTLSDSALGPIARFKNLKDMQFLTQPSFSADGLAEFVSNLDPDSNRGLELSLQCCGGPCWLSKTEEASVDNQMRTRVEGQFSIMRRGDSVSSSDSESDSI